MKKALIATTAALAVGLSSVAGIPEAVAQDRPAISDLYDVIKPYSYHDVGLTFSKAYIPLKLSTFKHLDPELVRRVEFESLTPEVEGLKWTPIRQDIFGKYYTELSLESRYGYPRDFKVDYQLKVTYVDGSFDLVDGKMTIYTGRLANLKDPNESPNESPTEPSTFGDIIAGIIGALVTFGVLGGVAAFLLGLIPGVKPPFQR